MNRGPAAAASTREQAAAALQRALDLSRELVAVADGGDVRRVARLDAERLLLLKSARGALLPMDEHARSVLREIVELNDRSLGLVEHRFRAKCRDIDMLSVGRRALRAYATTRL
jgi:hypothetical protein